MSPLGILVLVVIVVVPLLVMLEGRRQRRRLEAMGEPVKPYSGGDLAGAGPLHLQGLFESPLDRLRKEPARESRGIIRTERSA